jgi:hypothetical protein
VWAAELVRVAGAGILERAREAKLASTEQVIAWIRELTRQASARERSIAGGLPAAAQPLVQPGLFDRRAVNEARRRQSVTALLTEDAASRLETFGPDAHIETRLRIVSIRTFGPRR